MEEEKVRDELKKTCRLIIVIGNTERLPIKYLEMMRGTIEKELAAPSLEVLKAPLLLIEKIEAKVRNSKQHPHQKQETIRHIERLRGQTNRLLRQINYGHVDRRRGGRF